MAATKPIRVVIDIRETDLWTELAPYRTFSATEGWWAELAPLDVGDIAFFVADAPPTAGEVAAAETETEPVGGAGFTTTSNTTPAPASSVCDLSGAALVLERKTAEDLGASQKDGRYREQRARLLALRGAGTAIGYVVEAPPWSPSMTRSWCRGSFNETHLQQAIVRLQLRYTIPVFQAATLRETAGWIRRMAKMLAGDAAVFCGGVASTACKAAAAYTEAIHVKKAENNTPERIFLHFLLGIPGLGKAAAAAVAAACDNKFSVLQTLSLDQLAEIKCGKKRLGAAVAGILFAAVHS